MAKQAASSKQQAAKNCGLLKIVKQKLQLNLGCHPAFIAGSGAKTLVRICVPRLSYKNGVTSLSKAFTLIELSIVLVIIGLIVGGVLVGRDLIAAAEIRAQISQIEKYNVAVNTFKVKYNYLPGDMPASVADGFGFWGNLCDGGYGKRDNNGLIEAPSNSPGYPVDSYSFIGNEPTFFWADLGNSGVSYCGAGSNQPCSGAGLIDFTFLGNTGCYSLGTMTRISFSSLTIRYMPVAKILNNNMYIYSNGRFNYFGIMGVLKTGPVRMNFSITPSQAYNIDAKIDDSIATTGNVQASYVAYNTQELTCAPSNGADCTAPPVSYAPASDSATSCYNTTNNNYSTSVNGGTGQNCALSFKFQ